MLLYNKPLEIKDKEGKILYTIKNLTLDAEYELDMLNYEIQNTRETLLASGKFVLIDQKEVDITLEYITALEEVSAELMKELEYKLIEFQTVREKKGIKVLNTMHILKALSKDKLVEMVKWLKEYIDGFEQVSYFECAEEVIQINNAFREYKLEIKKKL